MEKDLRRMFLTRNKKRVTEKSKMRSEGFILHEQKVEGEAAHVKALQ